MSERVVRANAWKRRSTSTNSAVLQMTKTFSNEWASKGIQVNWIAPRFMETAMTPQYQMTKKLTDYSMTRVPAVRWGESQDPIPAALFLAAPGNTFITGACIIVDRWFRGR
ncbi:hypothetical protein LTR93_011374 [Exophiala xenobiotica]|nr:hypothetical protein LTR93_011374 [Exophiala xenobiotica]